MYTSSNYFPVQKGEKYSSHMHTLKGIFTLKKGARKTMFTRYFTSTSIYAICIYGTDNIRFTTTEHTYNMRCWIFYDDGGAYDGKKKGKCDELRRCGMQTYIEVRKQHVAFFFKPQNVYVISRELQHTQHTKEIHTHALNIYGKYKFFFEFSVLVGKFSGFI